MWMNIYRYRGNLYGDGIVLINTKIVGENTYNLYQNAIEWEFIGRESFSIKILRKLDKYKTLDSHGEIDLSYID